MAKQTSRRFAFSAYTFDTATGELTRGGRKLRIPDQAARLLAALLQNPGAMVSREELKTILWPEGEVLDYDRSINRAISQLRTILRDHSTKSGTLIDTLPKRGYRFTAPVRDVTPTTPNRRRCGSIPPMRVPMPAWPVRSLCSRSTALTPRITWKIPVQLP